MKFCQISSLINDQTPDMNNTLGNIIAGITTALLRAKSQDSPGLYSKIYELLDFISMYCTRDLRAEDIFDPSFSSELPVFDERTSQKLSELTSYINDRYMDNISLADAAAALGYTPPYLSNFIKKHLGLTFQECLNYFRVKSSTFLLKYSDDSLLRVATISGFPNQTSFQNAFKKQYLLSPEEYIGLHHQSAENEIIPKGISITNEDFVQDYIYNYMNYNISPSNIGTDLLKEEVDVSFHNRTGLKKIWNYLINMGSAANFEKITCRNHLEYIQKELHFEYGRCTEVFSLVQVSMAGQEKHYDFSKLHRLIDFMRSINLKPFWDIDCKPFLIYKRDGNDTDNYRQYLASDQYDEVFYQVLPDFLKSCVQRYGFDELSTWKFEIWRRYNNKMTSIESPEDFCERFQKIAGIIKSIVPGACVGGPGFNSFLASHHFSDLLDEWRRDIYIYRPDFISAYFFPFVIPKEINISREYTVYSSLNSMPEKLREYQLLIREKGFDSVPFYITEYSAHMTIENYINDSTYPAVYVLFQAMQNNDFVDAIGYWLYSDITLEIGHPNAPFFGGNGLLSKNQIPKPVFYAHKFLNHTGSFLLGKGAHYAATLSSNGAIQILFFHYSEIKEEFVVNPDNHELLQYPYSAFEDIPALELQLTITHMPEGSYQIKEQTLDLNFGGVLKAWGDLNNSPRIGEEEKQYLLSRSVPSFTIRQENIKDSCQIRCKLSYNEAKLIVLQPQF